MTTPDMRETLAHCGTPDCYRPSDIVTAITVLTPEGKPFCVGIGAYCTSHRNAEPRPNYAELVDAAHQSPKIPVLQTLLDRWPEPIRLTRGPENAR